MDDVRKLVRVVAVDDILPAANADRLELAVIGGWQVVVGKGQFAPGDKVVFAEVDSLIPADDPKFGFSGGLRSQAKDVDGVRYVRIRTVKLRGNLSQGIVFPLNNFPELVGVSEGVDISNQLGIIKYEPAPTGEAHIAGDFDLTVAHKSDSERVQNLVKDFDMLRDNYHWVATEKLDGQSITVAKTDGELRIFTRNKEVDTANHKLFSVHSRDWFERVIPEGWALQGELIGEGIQGNKLKVRGLDYRVFTVFDHGREVPRTTWLSAPKLAAMAVPELDINLTGFATAGELIDFVDGMKSAHNPDVLAEGVVFHEVNGTIVPRLGRSTFKVISNKFLCKFD